MRRKGIEGREQKINFFLLRYVRTIYSWKFKKIRKMTTGYSKSEKIDPWVSKSEGKGTKSEPRDTKSEPKGTQREPKGPKSEPAGAKSDPTGAKREPKVSQIQHKINIKDKVAKSMDFS